MLAAPELVLGSVGLQPLLEHENDPHHFSEVCRMNLPVLLLKIGYVFLSEYASCGELLQAVVDKVTQGWMGQGPHTKRQSKAVLTLVDDFFRQKISQGLLEKPPQLLSLDFVIGWELTRKLYYSIVQ
jgi:hypothetical protein